MARLQPTSFTPKAIRARKWRHAHPKEAYRKTLAYRTNVPEKVKEWNRKSRTKRRTANVLIVRKAKNIPCTDCGQWYPHYVMDFDHVNGKKSFNVGTFGAISTERLLAEIAKCDVVCANCHRIRTYGGNGNGE